MKYSLYEASTKKVKKVPSVGAGLPNGSGGFRGPRGTYFGGHSVPWALLPYTYKSQLLPPNIQSLICTESFLYIVNDLYDGCGICSCATSHLQTWKAKMVTSWNWVGRQKVYPCIHELYDTLWNESIIPLKWVIKNNVKYDRHTYRFSINSYSFTRPSDCTTTLCLAKVSWQAKAQLPL